MIKNEKTRSRSRRLPLTSKPEAAATSSRMGVVFTCGASQKLAQNFQLLLSCLRVLGAWRRERAELAAPSIPDRKSQPSGRSAHLESSALRRARSEPVAASM